MHLPWYGGSFGARLLSKIIISYCYHTVCPITIEWYGVLNEKTCALRDYASVKAYTVRVPLTNNPERFGRAARH